jgi:hypothetical protein
MPLVVMLAVLWHRAGIWAKAHWAQPKKAL